MLKFRAVVVAVAVAAVVLVAGPVRAQWDEGEAEDEPTDQWIGSYRLSLRANYSTCDNIAVGDKRTVTLDILRERGLILARETDGAKKVLVLDQNVVGKKKALLVSKPDKGQVGYDLTLAGKKVRGRRVIANPQPCAIIYDVTGTKP